MSFGPAAALFAASQIGQGFSALQQGRFNQEVAEQQAQAARTARAVNRRAEQRRFRELQGENLARTLAAGVDVSGSVLQQRIKNRFEFLQDQRAADFNTEVQARQAEARGELARFKGLSSFGTSLLRAGASASLLSDDSETDTSGNVRTLRID
ncbi:hypothetical protein GWO43_06055 [candidate division KSB1 bacterium]|nr:hypothetical protein [candidate division KSB1 bacterium]NIS23515.1 hypothetical protein [candidate division KSB1 bacterium]NIT70451.1 hypothetical protein [candidate division KSB1 bacterium]NIU24139.1 hypothetical protein [candidate division KSB1 bacterium]NIU93269.1 hypothetical protein [candidate division KSB1 bacterium]